MAVEEHIVGFESAGEELHGVVHVPAQHLRGTLVFCHPFAEEKKCSHRTMVEAARAFAAEGWAVLRFDMRGCGDSPCRFGEVSLTAWLHDIHAALDAAERETATTDVGLLGLRLGATLAAEVAEERHEVACLVLWEPVIDGEGYVRQNLRRSVIKAMMTRYEGGEDTKGAALEARALGEGTVDFDGYEVPEEMRAQIDAIDLTTPRSYPGPVLVLNLGARETVDAPMQRLAGAYEQGTAAAVRQEPVWQRIGLMDATATIKRTLEWLQRIR